MNMALFDIQRFVPDVEEVPEDQPRILLRKLKEQVKKKKKAKLCPSLHKTPINVDSTAPKDSLKRKKGIEEKTKTKTKKSKLSTELIQKDDKSLGNRAIEKKSKDSVKLTNKLNKSSEGSKNVVCDVVAKDIKKEKKVKKNKTETDGSENVILENNVNSEEQMEEDHVDQTLLDKEVDKTNIKSIKDGPHVIGNFTVLGNYIVKKTVKVKHKLPDWLDDPGVISSTLTETPIDKLGLLDDVLLIKLQENNISHFFPVQTEILPLLLNQITDNNCFGKDGYQPSDICVSAPTGSGKTLAFALPIIQTLLNRVVCRVRALVVLPVRDLALQVYKVFQTYCKGTGLRVTLLGGHSSFRIEQDSVVVKRLNGYFSLADIVVATPGRLVDHINKTPGFDLSHLRFLVIDEADRMMENIKQDWLSQVENAVLAIHNSGWSQLDRLPPRPLTVNNCSPIKIAFQKLLFSATLSQDPEKLQQLNLFQPQLYTTMLKPPTKDSVTSQPMDTENTAVAHENKGDFVGKFTTPATLKERHIECKSQHKPLSVLHCIHNLNYRQILCFTNSVESTHRLFLLIKLCGGIKVREFSSAMSGAARQKIITEFSNGNVEMIICSDAMARGMDINNVQYVILYDKPNYIETYIHRVGRTARAGKAGTAITILEKREVCSYKAMLKDAGKEKFKKLKIKPNKLQSLNTVYDPAIQKLPAIIKAEKQERREVH